jgi:hypothetical protein
MKQNYIQKDLPPKRKKEKKDKNKRKEENDRSTNQYK